MRYASALLLLAACEVGEVGPGNIVTVDAPTSLPTDAPTSTTDAPAASGLRITANTQATATAEFTPNNIVAVWIEGSNGFVKTIRRHSGERTPNLVTWIAAANDPADVDGLSGASRGAYAPLDVTWDMKNKDGVEVPDGTYYIRMELADSNNVDGTQNNVGLFSFSKGNAPQSQMNQTNGNFSSVFITYTP
jgi:hypothetical protein